MFEFILLLSTADPSSSLSVYPDWVGWLESVFMVFAIVGTGLVVIQFLMACLGFLDLDSADIDVNDVDLDSAGDGADASGDGDSDLYSGSFSLAQYFSFRSLVGFSSFFGLVGLWGLSVQLPLVGVLGLAFACGGVASFCITRIMRAISSLHSDGNFQVKNALGQTGTVYTPISAQRSGTGKVQIVIDGQTEEFEAITDFPETLSTGTHVTVVEIIGKTLFLVDPQNVDSTAKETS